MQDPSVPHNKVQSCHCSPAKTQGPQELSSASQSCTVQIVESCRILNQGEKRELDLQGQLTSHVLLLLSGHATKMLTTRYQCTASHSCWGMLHSPQRTKLAANPQNYYRFGFSLGFLQRKSSQQLPRGIKGVRKGCKEWQQGRQKAEFFCVRLVVV